MHVFVLDSDFLLFKHVLYVGRSTDKVWALTPSLCVCVWSVLCFVCCEERPGGSESKRLSPAASLNLLPVGERRPTGSPSRLESLKTWIYDVKHFSTRPSQTACDGVKTQPRGKLLILFISRRTGEGDRPLVGFHSGVSESPHSIYSMFYRRVKADMNWINLFGDVVCP